MSRPSKTQDPEISGRPSDRLVVSRSRRGLRGEIRPPGDKSITHRAVILGSLAEGTTELDHYLASADCLHTAEAFRALGLSIDLSPERMKIGGRGPRGLTEPDRILDLGNSGTAIRLLLGLLSGQSFFTVLTGDESLRRRPMKRVVDPLKSMGASIWGRRSGEFAPLAIAGRALRGVDHQLSIASAQVKSALLLAGLFADGKTAVTEPAASRDHTERIFSAFGIPIERDGLTCRVEPVVRIAPARLRIPGDPSSAAFFLVAATIVPDSELLIREVGINPTRTGLLEILGQMGAKIRIENRRKSAGEPVADLVVSSAPLSGVKIGSAEVPKTIDEFPILCVAAAAAQGETIISGAEELRVKESDRIRTMATELRGMGVRIEEQPDGLVIEGGAPLTGKTVQSHGDHRVAMALSIAGLIANGETTVEDAAWIETSYPGFAETLFGLTR